MWPKCAFGDQKGLIWIEAMSFGNPPHYGTKNCGLFKIVNFIFIFYGQKVVFWVKKIGVLGCFGPSVREQT